MSRQFTVDNIIRKGASGQLSTKLAAAETTSQIPFFVSHLNSVVTLKRYYGTPERSSQQLYMVCTYYKPTYHTGRLCWSVEQFITRTVQQPQKIFFHTFCVAFKNHSINKYEDKRKPLIVDCILLLQGSNHINHG